jgi:hypothetical protein
VPTTSSPSDPILAKSIDEIEVIVGEALLADDFGTKDASEAEKRQVARRWFENNLAAFRAHVCGSEVVKQGIAGPAKKDRNALLGALVDVLGSHYGTTVPVAALSVMIIHYGIDRLCPALGTGE